MSLCVCAKPMSAFRLHLATPLSLKHDCRLHPVPPTSLCVIKVFDLPPSLQRYTYFHTHTHAAATVINGWEGEEQAANWQYRDWIEAEEWGGGQQWERKLDRTRVLNKERERKGETEKGSEERRNNSLHRIKGKSVVTLPSDISIHDALFI